MIRSLVHLALLALVAIVAVSAFGWLHGLGLAAAVYVLVPYAVRP